MVVVVIVDAPRHRRPSDKLNVVDSTITTRQAAEALGVSIPTVRRAVQRNGLRIGTTPGGHLRLTPDDLDALRAELGAVPVIDGLTRPQVRVLAALSRAPLGLRSERAVARAAGLSPTAAGRAMDALLAVGLVRSDERTLAEGRAVTGTVWRILHGPAWSAIAARVSTTVLPAPEPVDAPRRLPRRFWHLFWNADPSALDVDRDAGAIAVRMLLGDDLEALSWACAHLPADALRRATTNRAADDRLRSLVDNVLAPA